MDDQELPDPPPPADEQEEFRDPATVILSQLQRDRQVIAYTLDQKRKALSIASLNWCMVKRWPWEERDEHGRMSKIHPGTIAKEIRQDMEQIEFLEGLLDADKPIPRPDRGDILEVVETSLVVPDMAPSGDVA